MGDQEESIGNTQHTFQAKIDFKKSAKDGIYGWAITIPDDKELSDEDLNEMVRKTKLVNDDLDKSYPTKIIVKAVKKKRNIKKKLEKKDGDEE